MNADKLQELREDVLKLLDEIELLKCCGNCKNRKVWVDCEHYNIYNPDTGNCGKWERKALAELEAMK